MSQNNKKRIFVGVSGGVDSSLSLALLKEQGHDVVGVFIRTWQPDWISCTWKEERRDAIRVCAHLEVPFLELDLEEEYRKGVAEYMVREYEQGRTPNPDVMCNREVKFGGFLRFAKKHGADYVATGHYARISTSDTGKQQLQCGVDLSKDQSYFLWTLSEKELPHIMFPVGGYTKKEVREHALKFSLPTAYKKDSQGICFIGEIDMKDFLRHYFKEKTGEVLDLDAKVIGTHSGSFFFTLGERHGFSIFKEHKGINDTPLYVVAKDIYQNTLTVSPIPVSPLVTKEMQLHSVNNQGDIREGDVFDIQTRYRGQRHTVTVTDYNRLTKTMKLLFTELRPLTAAGQSIVFYKEDTCLGGGIVNI